MDPCLVGRRARIDLGPYGLEKLLVPEQVDLETDDVAGELAGPVRKPAQFRESTSDGFVKSVSLGDRATGVPSRAAGFLDLVQNSDWV